jgi:quinohemoprotein ethanol dehydrogenase
VIMQANKNGFFYVLDRATGEFITGAAFVNGVTWATGLDAKTGRPVEVSGVAESKPVMISPSPDGAHNWNPIAFSPATGLVYLAAKTGTEFVHAPDAKWKYNADRDNVGLDADYNGPLNDALSKAPESTGELVAWDPVQEKAAWRAKYPTAEGGGALATAGNLVFQGRADGILAAYRANDGKQLWTFDAGTGIIGPPVTYLVNGVQYVSVLAGWGGGAGGFNTPGSGPIKPGYGRMVTFMIDGKATLNAPAYGHKDPPVPVLTTNASKQTIHEGEMIFNSQCAGCHGLNAVAGPNPDLRYASKGTLEGIEGIVLGGSRASLGMPSFQKILTPKQVGAIQAYLITRTKESAKP